MKILQAVELRKETSDFYLKQQLNSKSHIRIVRCLNTANFHLFRMLSEYKYGLGANIRGRIKEQHRRCSRSNEFGAEKNMGCH